VSCAKTAEPIEMLFGLWACMGPRNRVFYGGPDLLAGRGNIELWGRMACPDMPGDILTWVVHKQLNRSRYSLK